MQADNIVWQIIFRYASKTKLNNTYCLHKPISIFFQRRAITIVISSSYSMCSQFFIFNFDTLVKEVLDQIAKTSPLIFSKLPVTGQINGHPLAHSFIYQKSKYKPRRSPLKFSVINLFTYLAKGQNRYIKIYFFLQFELTFEHTN